MRKAANQFANQPCIFVRILFGIDGRIHCARLFWNWGFLPSIVAFLKQKKMPKIWRKKNNCGQCCKRIQADGKHVFVVAFVFPHFAENVPAIVCGQSVCWVFVQLPTILSRHFDRCSTLISKLRRCSAWQASRRWSCAGKRPSERMCANSNGSSPPSWICCRFVAII